MLFDFVNMAPYEDRVIDLLEQKNLRVSTAAINDSKWSYETAVCHVDFNNNEWIIVENYDTKADAVKGHKRWCKRMTGKKLPDMLQDVSGAEIKGFIDMLDVSDGIFWRKGFKCPACKQPMSKCDCDSPSSKVPGG